MNKTILTIFLFFMISGRLFSQTTTDCDGVIEKWAKTMGGIEADAINDIAIDSDGNILVTGYFSDNFAFQSQSIESNGDKDFFIAKLDSQGELIWIKTGGSENEDYGKSLAIDSQNNIYILGAFKGSADFSGTILNSNNNSIDLFVIKYSTIGNVVWAKKFGNSYDEMAGGIAIDSDDGPIITGTFYKNSITFGANTLLNKNSYDFFIAKYSSDGNERTGAAHSSGANDFGLDIACSPTGEIYVIGEFSGTLIFGGSNNLAANGTKNIFIAKYISDNFNIGNTLVWAVQTGNGSVNDKVGAVTLDENGNIYICYYSDIATNKAHVDKFDNNGNKISAESFNFGSSGNIYPTDIAVDKSQNVYLTGKFNSAIDFGDGIITPAGQDDLFFVKYNSSGNYVYDFNIGSIENDNGTAICLDKNDDIVIGGFFNNSINIDNNTYQSNGDNDMMIIKYEKYFSFGEIKTYSPNCDPNDMCIGIEVLGGIKPLSYLWSTGDSNKDICGTSVGNDYSITVTDDNGCFIDTTINIPTITMPNISLSNKFICPNDSEVLDPGSGFSSYLWNTGVTTQTITVTTPGTYSVTVTDASSCTASASSIVKYLVPKVDIFTDETIYFCIGDSVKLDASGHGFYLWTWSTGAKTNSINPRIEGKYWVSAFDGNCYQTDTIEIINYPHVSIDLGQDDYFCEGDSIMIDTGGGFVTYLWSDNSTNEYLWVTSEGSFSVTVTDINGCKAEDEIYMSKKAKPEIDLGEDGVYCTNDGVVLSPVDNPQEYSFFWSTNEVTSSIEVKNSGNYWVRVTSRDDGCSASDTISVILHPIPRINLGSDKDYCEGDSVLIEAPDNFDYYKWSNGSDKNFTYISGNQTLILTITDKNGCTNSDTISGMEHIVPYPHLGNDTTLCEGATYQLSPINDYVKYNWNTGSSKYYIDITEPGTYSVTVFDDFGCTNSDYIYIKYDSGPNITNIKTDVSTIIVTATDGTPPYIYSIGGEEWQESNTFKNYPPDFYNVFVKDYNLCVSQRLVYLEEAIRIPDFFTPNNDGYNDVWEIEGLFNYPNATVSVFDRFGKLLIQFNATESWDGTYNGNPLPSDTYWYVIEFGNNIPPRKGDITIKR